MTARDAMTERRKRLEKQFNNFVLAGIPGLQREGYNPARFLEMIRETGSPYATTIVLLNDPSTAASIRGLTCGGGR
jgi:hypothetical protein